MIYFGVVDVIGNGVDEDCDGVDVCNFDVDCDGFFVLFDCNDGNVVIYLGVFEVRGNDVDENCDNIV